MQTPCVGAHAQVPFTHAPQQSELPAQGAPMGLHAHAPPAQTPLQQSALPAQRAFGGAHPQAPFTHAPQQSELPAQAVPLGPQAQVPPYPQEPLQHCASEAHCWPAATQAHWPPVQVCEQQSPAC